MPEATFYLRANPPAETVQEFVTALAAGLENTGLDTLSIATNIDASQFSLSAGPANGLRDRADVRTAVEELAAQSNFVMVRRISTGIPSPQGHQQRLNIQYENPDDVSATITLKCDDNAIFKQYTVRLAKAFHQHMTLARRGELIGEQLPKLEREKLRYYERAVSDLTAAVSKLGEVTTQQIERQAIFLQEKTAQLDAQLQERTEVLRKEHEAKLAAVEQERAALAKEKAEIDIRRSTAARRSLLTDMRSKIGEEFTISERTLSRRLVIHSTCIPVILCGLALIVTGFYKTLMLDKFDWHYMALTWTGVVLAGTTLVYYLRWNNHWFSQLAQNEFNTRKLNIDVLRASWVAEMLLEWNDEKDKPLPTELVTSFTEGLFRGGDWVSTDHHPVSDVMKLLGELSKLKVGGGTIEISRKGD